MARSLHPKTPMRRDFLNSRPAGRLAPRPARSRVAALGIVALVFAGAAAAQPAAGPMGPGTTAPADGDRAGQENSFGVEVASKGLWKEAAYRWERAVELDPLNSKARNNLAVAYERSGKFEEALEAYEAALELQPSSEQIRQNYELFREAYERKKRKDRDAARSRSR